MCLNVLFSACLLNFSTFCCLDAVSCSSLAQVNRSDVAFLQTLVYKIFSDYPVIHDGEPFIEFGDSSAEELNKVYWKLIMAGTPQHSSGTEVAQEALAAAITLALDLISNLNHPGLVKIALGIFLTHSKEARNLGVLVPPLSQHQEFKNLQVTTREGVPLSNPVTADTLKGYELLSYFRNDYNLVGHHHHWHLLYPFSGVLEASNKTPRRTIDRQGELFLYMHSQMIARYNAELLAWGFDLLYAWSYDDILTFSYTPAPRLRETYGARPPFQGWFETRSPKHFHDRELFPSKRKMIKWRDNIFKAIEDGFFYTKKRNNDVGKFVLSDENAMNWVGIVVEAEHKDLQEVFSGSGEYIDRSLYGSVHNLGHNKFAEIGYHEYTSDKNPLGVMHTSKAAPRDPSFWLWHRHIDDFRQLVVKKYVHNLWQFQPDVKIIDIKIIPRDKTSDTPIGGLMTILGPPQLEKSEVNAKINHEPYKWELIVESLRSNPPEEFNPQIFTVRLFIAPKALIQDQCSWLEMDKFTHTLTKRSEVITRLDTASSVAHHRTVKRKKPSLCGWPQNMMLPVGTPSGIDYVGFAMLTDDKLIKSESPSLSLCGSSDGKYPDPRGMGYPFDKTWASRVESITSLPDIVKDVPHIKLTDFKIYRSTQLYQGTPSPSSAPHRYTVTWEKDVQYFFTSGNFSFIKHTVDLGRKEDVMANAMKIYKMVLTYNKSYGEAAWNTKKIADFKQWMDNGMP